jgi:hypothetical protein
MGNPEISTRYRSMSSKDQRAFDRWLEANSILGTIFAELFLAMAVAGWIAEGPPSAAIADSREPSSTAAPKSNN